MHRPTYPRRVAALTFRCGPLLATMLVVLSFRTWSGPPALTSSTACSTSCTRTTTYPLVASRTTSATISTCTTVTEAPTSRRTTSAVWTEAFPCSPPPMGSWRGFGRTSLTATTPQPDQLRLPLDPSVQLSQRGRAARREPGPCPLRKLYSRGTVRSAQVYTARGDVHKKEGVEA